MKATKLQKEILKTLLFFNFHNRPLTLKEIHQFLGTKANESEIFLTLMDLVRKKKIIEKNKYFVLTNYSKILRSQKRRESIKQKLIKKTKNFLFLFKLTPYVRGVFLANSLSMGMPSKSSDIDVVVLVKKDRLWVARFFLNILFLFFGQRRRNDLKKDPGKFCLSYFAEIKTNLQFLKLKEDPLLIYWLATLKPILGGRACEAFLEENKWLLEFLPNLQLAAMGDKIKPLGFVAFLKEKIINPYGNWLEKILFQLQAKRIGAKNKKDEKLALPYIYKSYLEGGRNKLKTQLKENFKISDRNA